MTRSGTYSEDLVSMLGRHFPTPLSVAQLLLHIRDLHLQMFDFL